MRLRVIDPNHCLCGAVVEEASKTVHIYGVGRFESTVVSYFIVATRPFDPKDPKTEDYRRFCQILDPRQVEEI